MLQGPFNFEAEYMRASVNRFGEPQGNVSFAGWRLQANYVLTGETRAYDFKSGSFGSITPEKESGAWEIAARYSYLDLTDKNVTGGVEHNVTLGTSWYANTHVRVIGNYILVMVDPSSIASDDNSSHTIHAVGARLQVVW